MEVFLLHHIHELPDGGEDVTLIGVYSSAESAELAKLRLCKQPGFRDSPAGFSIEPYTVDADHWSEGFISWAEAIRTTDQADA
jgi:hypothetical protein